MITKLFKEPYIFTQTADSDMEIPEQPVSICKDESELIVLQQESNSIVLNKKSLNELLKFLKTY